MLKLFKRLEKTRNFVLLLFAIVMVVSLVLFYAPASNTVTANLAQSSETAASVSGNDISIGEIVRQQENYSRFSQGQTLPARMMLDSLIDSRIARIEAERIGLTASDAEVAAEIRRQWSTDGTPFNQATYVQNITEQFGSVATFEQNIRDDLSAKKLEAFITAGVTVSEEEALTDFQRKNVKFDVNYVTVSTAELAKKITPTEDSLRSFFEGNKSNYFINFPQKKIKYVFVNTSKLGEKMKISDADLKTEFDSLPDDKKIAGVLGQELVLRLGKPEFESQVQAKANELIQQLRKDGPTVSEETFATIAKGHSENPATAPNGGKLSGPVRENPNNVDDPYQRLLKMSPGEVSEPITYQSRIFILRRGDEVPKTFEMAKKEIEAGLRNRRSYAVAAELAQKVADSLKETKDTQKTAQAFAAEANMSVAEMVRETGYLKPGDDVPNIGISPQFEEGIKPLEAVNDVGEKTPIQNGFAIPMLVDKKEPRDAEFAEVRERILEVVRNDTARNEVEKIAQQIAEKATSAGGLGAAASSSGWAAKEQKNFVLGSPLGEGLAAGTNELLENTVYDLKPGEVSKTPIKVGDSWVVVGVTNRQDAESAEFAKQRSGLIEQMLTKKRTSVFTDYLAVAKRKLHDSGSIRVYQTALDKIEPSGPPTENPIVSMEE
ncbi:peptidylprolyl isomerase [soil metagenome]